MPLKCLTSPPKILGTGVFPSLTELGLKLPFPWFFGEIHVLFQVLHQSSFEANQADAFRACALPLNYGPPHPQINVLYHWAAAPSSFFLTARLLQWDLVPNDANTFVTQTQKQSWQSRKPSPRTCGVALLGVVGLAAVLWFGMLQLLGWPWLLFSVAALPYACVVKKWSTQGLKGETCGCTTWHPDNISATSHIGTIPSNL